MEVAASNMAMVFNTAITVADFDTLAIVITARREEEFAMGKVAVATMACPLGNCGWL